MPHFYDFPFNTSKLESATAFLIAVAFVVKLFYKCWFMKIVRLYTGKDGESHFEKIETEWKSVGGVEASSIQDASGIFFRRAPAGHVQEWHPAPQRQYVITLSGQAEIEIGNGTVQRFGPGDIVLAEDVTGRGHITRAVGNEPRIYVTIPLK